jgi:predicted HicB family RNase H-like nuclease
MHMRSDKKMSIQYIYKGRRFCCGTELVQRKTTQFNMRMDPELKEVAEKAAAADGRSLASLIEKLLEDYCRVHGFKTERKTRRP